MNIKIYIDFDGVILDTWEIIFTSIKKNLILKKQMKLTLKK